VAAGDVVGGCKIDVGGVDSDMAVAEVAVTVGFDVVALFTNFFLLEDARK
jgi:hypothetical protein